MSRIPAMIQNSPDRKLLIPFFTAGFPSVSKTVDLALAAVDAGVDLIEFGVPFSDPLADGPEIQYSSHKALTNGVDLKSVFRLVEQVRRKSDVPLVLMGYYNPIIRRGVERFLSDCSSSGVDGLIIPDLPVEEGRDLKLVCDNHDVSTIFLAAPTSTDKRLKMIDQNSTGFVYAVTVTGVTGTGKVFDRSTDNYLKKLRSILRSKFVAGFGVSNEDNALRLAKNCDGVVIGSALVRMIRQSKNRQAIGREVCRFLRKIREAI